MTLDHEKEVIEKRLAKRDRHRNLHMPFWYEIGPVSEYPEAYYWFEIFFCSYVEYWQDLSDERQYEGGPIPSRCIKDQARDLDLDEETTRFHIRMIKELDRTYFEWQNDNKDPKKKRKYLADQEEGDLKGGRVKRNRKNS